MIKDGDASTALPKKIDLKTPVPHLMAASLLQQFSSQVRQIHESGRVHRAITLATIEQDTKGVFQLSAVESACCLGRFPATKAWLPPELHSSLPLELSPSIDAASATLESAGISIDPRQIDIYQLGVLLCQLVTGEPAESYLSSLRTKQMVPQPLRPVIERSLGCDGQIRFRTVDEFSEMLKSVSADARPDSEVEDRATSTPPHSKPDTVPNMDAPRHPVSESGFNQESLAALRGQGEAIPFKKLGHYEIVSRIGQGGMGDVYLGYERSLDRKVAIKVLPAEFSRQEDFVRRFRAEATAAAKLIHPNIIQIFFIGETDGFHYFAMQFVEGESLAELLKRQIQLSVDEALTIIEQVFAGLAVAHQHGLVHRDIKPGNVLLDRIHNRALLADFGLVKSLQSSSTGKTATGVIMGTADYMPPEQARGQEIDYRADLYSMGVLMYQMVSGRLPFEADSPTAMIFQHVYEPPPPLREKAPHVPQALSETIEKLLNKSPDDRHQSAEEVLADLRAIRAGHSASSIRRMRPKKDQVPAPAYQENAGDIPETEAKLSEIQPLNWWERARDRAATLLRRHSPEALQRLQNTQQQIGGAIAEYERRQRKLKQLVREAESVILDLKAQAVAQRAVANEDPAIARSADELDRQVVDQDEQLGSINLKLAKVNATLQRLKSERDILNARLQTAEASAKVSSGRVRHSVTGKRVIAWASILLVLVAGTFFLKTRIVSNKSTEPVAPQPKMAVAPFSSNDAKRSAANWALYYGVPVEYTNSIGMKFRLIPPGEFTMGGTGEETIKAIQSTDLNAPNARDIAISFRSELPRHQVVFGEPVYMSVYEVTQQQYETIMGQNPSYFSKSGREPGRVRKVAQIDTANHPVEGVTWQDATEFAAKLSLREGLEPCPAYANKGGTGYRLPSEAEWEFVVRGGTSDKFWFGDAESLLTKVGWFGENSDGLTHQVGKLEPNPFGLYDVYGNVSEWTRDGWDSEGYSRFSKTSVDPVVLVSQEDKHVTRGGSFAGTFHHCRSASHFAVSDTTKDATVGFRVALSLEGVRATKKRSNKNEPPKESEQAIASEKLTDGIDLIQRIDLGRDVYRGTWKKEGTSLMSSENSCIYLPVKTPEDYELMFNVKRLSGKDTLVVGFMMAGRQGMFAFDLGAGLRSGLYLDGVEPQYNAYPGEVFKTNARVNVVLTIHPGHLLVVVDGKTILDWHGDPHRLCLYSPHGMPCRETPFLQASNVRYQITSATMKAIEPEPAPARKARLESPIEIMPLFDLKRDVARGDWKIIDQTLHSSGAQVGEIYLPVEVPEEYRVSATVEVHESTTQGQAFTFGFIAGTSISQIVVSERKNLGLDLVDGHRWNINETTISGVNIGADTPAQVALTVTKQGIRFELDGRVLIDWRGDPRRLSIAPDWALPDGRKLFIGSSSPIKIRDLKIGPPVDPPATPNHQPFAVGHPVDLLPLVDPVRDCISGTWSRLENSLRVKGGPGHSFLVVPSDVPTEYKLTLILNRESGGISDDNCLFLKLPVGNSMADIGIDAYASSLSGIYLDGHELDKIEFQNTQVIPPHGRQEITCFVRKTGIKVETPDRTIFDWHGNAKRLASVPDHATPCARIAVGSWNSGFRFEHLAIEPLEPTTFPPRSPLTANGKLLPALDPERDSRKGNWKFTKEGLVNSSSIDCVMRIPFVPPKQYVLSADVERLNGSSQFCFGLVVDGKPCCALVDLEGRRAGLERIDELNLSDKLNLTRRLYQGALLPKGRSVMVRCFVLPDTVLVTCDETEVVRWHGDSRRLSFEPYYQTTNYSEEDRSRLWIGTGNSQFLIRDLELKPLSDDAAGKLANSFSAVYPMVSRVNDPLRESDLDLETLRPTTSKELTVLSAKYGTYNESADITEQLAGIAAETGQLLLIVDDSLASLIGPNAAIPSAGTPKSLRLKYRLNGAVQFRTVEQNESVQLGSYPRTSDEAAKEFTLLDARLGTGLYREATWEEATNQLRSFVKNNGLSMTREQLSKFVGNQSSNPGGNGPRSLFVRYRYNGRERVQLISSNNPVSLGNVALQPGLIRTAYDGTDFQRQRATRIDSKIDVDFGFGAPEQDLNSDDFSLRWQGMLSVPKAGKYTFFMKHDDGCRLWIDDELVINNWGSAGEERAEVLLTDRPHSFIVEFCERQVGASIFLEWQGDSIARQIIPPSAFSHDPRQASQLGVK